MVENRIKLAPNNIKNNENANAAKANDLKAVEVDAFETHVASFPWLNDLRSLLAPSSNAIATKASNTTSDQAISPTTTSSNDSLKQAKNRDKNQRRKQKKKEKKEARQKEQQDQRALNQSTRQNQASATKDKPKAEKKTQRRAFFDPWIPEKEAREGLMTNSFVSGTLRINKRKRKLAYVVAEGFDRDIVIIGSRDRNRGLQGDLVVVQVFGELKPDSFDDYKNGSDLLKSSGKTTETKENNNDEKDDNNNGDKIDLLDLDEEEEEDDVPHPVAKVVYILERRPGQTFLMPYDWKPGKNSAALESDDDDENKKQEEPKQV